MDERLKDSGSFPKVILLDTTNFCNLKCSMCGHRLMTREKGRMSMDLVRKIVDEIAEKDKSARVWMVFFGEALILRYKLLWGIYYAKKRGLKDVVLNSNGNLLDKEMALGLIESGLDAIYIGIDAFSEATYNITRVGGDYIKTMNNVQTLLRLIEYRKSRLKVFVQFVEMEENKHEVKDFTDYWTDQGAIVKIRPKITWAGTVNSYNLKQIDRYPCYWAMRSFNICWDGRVVLCSVDYDAKYVAGNINQESIEQVWRKMKPLRQAHLDSKFDMLPEFCRDCTDWQMARAKYYDS